MIDFVDKDQWIRGRSKPAAINEDAESLESHGETPEVCIVGPHPETQRTDCKWSIDIENSDGTMWSITISELAAMALRECPEFQIQPYA